jgi:hypothetical protein
MLIASITGLESRRYKTKVMVACFRPVLTSSKLHGEKAENNENRKYHYSVPPPRHKQNTSRIQVSNVTSTTLSSAS